MSRIFNLVKKELEKIFLNPRAILTNFILPGVLIYIVYAIMGGIMVKTTEDNKKAEVNIAVVNESQYFNETYNLIKDNFNLKFTIIDDVDVDDFTNIIEYDKLENHTESETQLYNRINNSINNKEYDVWLCFNKDFDSKYLLKEKAIVGVFSKRTYDTSQLGTQVVSQVLQMLQPQVISLQNIDFSTHQDMSQELIGTMVPMLLIVFVIAGGMGVCSDSIAGEKERGTISTLLMTPIKRSHIIYGKIISLVIITIVAAIGPFIAVITSIPRLMRISGLDLNLGLDVLSGSVIAQVFLLVLIAALFSTSIMILISTIAKSVKEANMVSSAFQIIAIVLGSVALTVKIGDNLGLFFVPILNLLLGINRAIIGTLTIQQAACVICSTLLYCIILIIIAVELFKSERILYSK